MTERTQEDQVPVQPQGRHAGADLEAALRRFEDAWQTGQSPRVEDFLPGVDDDLRLEVLVELVHSDLDHRHQAGQPIRMEEYFERFPELNQARSALTLIQSEYELRREREADLSAEDYARRFPQFREELTSRLLGRYEWPKEPAPPKSSPTSETYPEVPGYEILGLLGRGGMAVVYKARDLKLNRLVALKMIHGGGHAAGEQLGRLLIEARAVARLQHEHIVQIYEVGDTPASFLALEYIDGGSLDRKIKAGLQPARQTAMLVETLARAIEVAHQHQIVHRDLKPANVLLTAAGKPKITDFGLAKQLDESVADPTRSGMIMGTPSYMAPEQTWGPNQPIGPATDVYALGAILYEMLTGRPPFKADTPLDTIEQVRSTDPVPPRRLVPNVPRDLETICLKCLQKEPPRRFSRAANLADDLQRFLAGEPIRARPVTRRERVVKWLRRRPAVAAVCALTLCLGIGVLVALANERRRQDTERLLDASDRRLQENEARREALAKRERFNRARDEALFHQTLMTGRGLLINTSKTRSWAQEALALYGVAPESGAGPTLDDAYDEAEKAGIVQDVYQLLLVLALTETQSPPGEKAEEPRRRAPFALACTDLANQLAPPTRAYHLRRARCLEALGKNEDAAAERAQAGRIHPATALDHFLLGQENYKRNQLDRAIQDFSSALLLKADDFWSQYYRTVCYVRLQKLAEARGGVDACLGLRQDFAWAYVVRAYLHAQSGAFDLADADYRKALALQPDADVRYCVLVNRGEMSIRRERLEVAVADLQEAIRLLPDQYHAHVNLARAYQQSGKYEAAAEQLDKAIALQPNAVVIYRERANLRLERADLAGALADLDKAIELEASPRDHFERGRIFYRLRDFNQSLLASESALQLRSDYAGAHRLRAECLFELKRFKEALDGFNAYAKNGKPSGEVFWERGRTRGILGDHVGAIDDYTLALKHQPDHPQTLGDRGWAYLACEAPKSALQDFEAVIRQKPEDADAYNGRGYAHVKLGQPQKAIADAREARKHATLSPRVIYNTARVYAQVVGKLEADPSQGTRENRELRYECQSQAFQLIRKALDLLPASQRLSFWQQNIQNDPAMNPIRRTSGFTQLEKEIASSRQGATETNSTPN